MDGAAVWKAITGRWLIVAAVPMVLAALAGILTMVRPPLYTASAEGLVSVSNAQARTPWALGNGAQYISGRMTSYAHLGTTTPVVLPVYTRLDLRDTPSVQLIAVPVPEQAVLRISATYSDPAEAAHIADGVLQELGATIARLENGNVVVTEVTPASIPANPSNLNVSVNVAVALAAGLLLGGGGAVGLQAIADRRAGRRRPELIDHDEHV